MKLFNFLFIASAAIALTSCGTKEEKTAYSLNVKSSSLKWKGSKNPEYFHEGSISFTSGTIEMEGDKLTSGTFSIDVNSIKAEDATLPADKKAMLEGHLKDTSFFFVANNPEITVKAESYEDGKLATVITILGQEIKQTLPVTLKKDDKGTVMISGKFDVDFGSLNMKGMQPDPATGERVLSVISFDLNVVLEKNK